MTDTYSWDTSVVLAWFKGEEDKPLDDVELVVREIEAKRANLVVSVMTYSEVLAVGDSEDAADQYRRFLQRSNVMQVNVDPPVSQMAVQIREDAKRAGVKCPKAADANIIATAILYEADALHTFDHGMLSLNCSQVVSGLKITQPILLSGQRALVERVDNGDVPLSLHPFTPEQALKKALNTPPPGKEGTRTAEDRSDQPREEK